MKRNQVVWTAIALVVIAAGFLVERATDDGAEATMTTASSVLAPTSSSPDASVGADTGDPDARSQDGAVDGGGEDAGAATTATTARVGGSAPTTAATSERGPPQVSDLPVITLDQLPVEALDVLDRIETGGPYDYRQDDSVFGNREGILPSRPSGHYREYTVETPGSPDRGARRIVAGADGERYWTDDHYDSFAEIVFS